MLSEAKAYLVQNINIENETVSYNYIVRIVVPYTFFSIRAEGVFMQSQL
jgi:hypothetical protein